MADKIKIYIALAIAIASLYAFYSFAAEYSLLYRTLGLIVAAIIALFIAYQTEMGRELISFVRNAVVEMKKVVWPDKKETTQTTLVVGLMVLIIGCMLWLFDAFVGWGISYLTGQG